MSEFPQYEAMRDEGASAHDLYRKARADGHDDITCIRMLRAVFGFSLREAKEVLIVASGTAASLDEHEERLARELEEEGDGDL
jgi:hypothetical protein